MFTKLESDITFSDIKAFCDEYNEGVRVEYKREMVRHIPKIVSSFANTQGGILIIGVRADNETNRVVAIDGISNPGGLEEQIIQSALTGIYPAVQPEVIIREVPDTDNVVVIIRVTESPQAPHAIQNSTRVYIRTGSITQPYELAEIDRIEYLLKRREQPQITTQQIIDRTEERVSRFFVEYPDITVIARPVFSYRPIISTGDIYEFAREADLSWLYSSRVVGGWFASTIRNSEFYSYWELNEYGIVYHRHHLDKIDQYSNSNEAKYVDVRRFVWEIGRTIEKATSLYKKCGYLGVVDITVQLREVFDETLLFYKFYSNILHGPVKSDDIEKQQCFDSEVLASLQCLPQDLIDRNKFIDTVDQLTDPLLWAFNIVVDDAARKELVKQLLLGERIL